MRAIASRQSNRPADLRYVGIGQDGIIELNGEAGPSVSPMVNNGERAGVDSLPLRTILVPSFRGYIQEAY